MSITDLLDPSPPEVTARHRAVDVPMVSSSQITVVTDGVLRCLRCTRPIAAGARVWIVYVEGARVGSTVQHVQDATSQHVVCPTTGGTP